jgi:hypothetical protein
MEWYGGSWKACKCWRSRTERVNQVDRVVVNSVSVAWVERSQTDGNRDYIVVKSLQITSSPTNVLYIVVNVLRKRGKGVAR